MRYSHHEHEHHCGGRRRGFFGGRHGRGSGPFSGGRFPGGPGMRAARMLASGDLQLIILLLLSERPRHGYEIIKGLEEHSSGVYSPSPGMVYPALTYLEETGHATAAAEGAKKLYSLTPAGAEYLAAHRTAADELWQQLARFGRKMADMQQRYAEDEDVAEDFGSGSHSQSRSEWQRMRAELRGLREELQAALYSKIESPWEEKQRVLDILRKAIAEIRGK